MKRVTEIVRGRAWHGQAWHGRARQGKARQGRRGGKRLMVIHQPSQSFAARHGLARSGLARPGKARQGEARSLVVVDYGPKKSRCGHWNEHATATMEGSL
ncbi:MAG: hypothetical protein U9Q07_00265 [Planctomycetota bacterium]|nr:hypothetical protein [Planctomycetota bacterium]